MQGWSIRLFRILGIQLAVHATFFLLLGYVAWAGWQDAVAQGAPGIYGALLNSGYIVIFFACVVLHELGHALAARRFGIGVPRILLLPIGGMAEFDSIPRQPSRELTIALAGPAVNFAIIAALGIFAPLPSTDELKLLFHYYFGNGNVVPELTFLQDLMVMNMVMGCFNLAPVFPMDGGRVLRAFLAMRFPYLTATLYAATVAKVLAGAGIFAALFILNPVHLQLAVLLVFIFLAGEMEYRLIKRKDREDDRWRQVLAQLHAAQSEPPPLPGDPSGQL